MSFRQHQQEFNRVCQDILSGRDIRRIVLSVTPGGGKSVIPQILAHRLVGPVVDKVCWVVPRLSLQEQGARNFLDARDRAIVGHRLEIREATNDPDPSRGTAGFITTYQALVQNPGYYAQEFSRWPKGYALVLDEPHHLKKDGAWHRAIDPLFQRARIVVLMSGTWDSDEPIAYIPYRDESDGTVKPDIPTSHVIQGDTAYIRYTRTQAISQQAIKPLRFQPHDGFTQFIDRSGQTKFLFSLAESNGQDASDGLFTALRTDYASQILDRMLGDFMGYRQHHPWAKAIVIAPSIQLARGFLKYIRECYHYLRSDIAVSEDDKAASNIKRFKTSHENGNALDVLVTVAMAYEGLDVPPITHLGFVTHIRSRPWVEQALARAARVVQGVPYQEQGGHVYGPDDPMLRQVMAEIQAEQDRGFRAIPTDGPRPGPGSGPDGPPSMIIAQLGGVTRSSAVDIATGERLSYERTAQLRTLAEQFGMRGIADPIVLEKFVKAAADAPPPADPVVATMPSLTPREREDRLRKAIEAKGREIDAKNGWEFGSINAMVLNTFKKARAEMSETELKEVWKWLQGKHPAL